MSNYSVQCGSTTPMPTMNVQESLITNRNPYLNFKSYSQCQDALQNPGQGEIVFLYLQLIFGVLRSVFELVCYLKVIWAASVILGLVFLVLYKSYWNPTLYVKELTDIGFDHIATGPERAAKITRAQRARRLGSKLPPPYPNGWFALLESSDLRVGDVKAVDILGQNLCVYRSESGAARCVDAYCPHLGAHLAAGGVVSGDCVACPFHKWRFDGTGQCVAVPGLETPPRGVSTRGWRTAETDGAVWLWHDAEEAPPRWTVEEAPELSRWGYRGRNEFVVSSHIQDIPENGADVAHLNAVHSPSLLTNLGEKYPFFLNFVGQHTWSAEWSRGEDHSAAMRLSHDYKFGKFAVFRIDCVATQMGPGLVRLRLTTAFGPILISQSVTPLSPLEQRVVHRVYSPWWNAPLAAAFLRGESYMFERDVAIWNNKRWVSSPAYVKSDKTIRAFRSWFSQFYSEHSISFRDALRRHHDPLDW